MDHSNLFLLGTDMSFCIERAACEIMDSAIAATDIHADKSFLGLPVVSWLTAEEQIVSDDPAYSVELGFFRVDQIASVVPAGPRLRRQLAEAVKSTEGVG